MTNTNQSDGLLPVELKGCPFCGESDVEAYRRPLSVVWHVYCTACEIHGHGEPSEADAIAAWNTRAKPTPVSGTDAVEVTQAYIKLWESGDVNPPDWDGGDVFCGDLVWRPLSEIRNRFDGRRRNCVVAYRPASQSLSTKAEELAACLERCATLSELGMGCATHARAALEKWRQS